MLDPNNAYYRRALKLKEVVGPTTSVIEGVITDGGFHLSWIEEQMYMEIFSDPQTYVLDISAGPAGPEGPEGPEGPPGPQGLQGPPPEVDYQYLIDQIMGQLNSGTVLTILGPSQIIEGLTGQFSLQLTTTGGNSVVTGPITIQTPIAGVTINASNLVTVSGTALTADANMTLNAAHTYLGTEYTATKSVVLKNALPVSIQASGVPASLNEGLTAQIVVVATYSNGATATKTAQCTFSSNNTSALTVSASGLVNALPVTANTPVTITVSFVEGSTSLQATLNTTVKNIVPTGLSISGPAVVNAGLTANYTATAQFSDGTTQDVTASTNFVMAIPAMGSFSTTVRGLFTASPVTTDTTGNVSAEFTASGVTVNDVHSITVLSGIVGIRPYYGTNPVTATKDSAFVLALSNRGPTASLVSTFTLDSGGPGSGITMYYAYPVSYGLAKFEDTSTPGFYGGWDGVQGDPTNPAKWGPMTVQVDTGGGVIVPFYLYATDYDGLGQVTWNASAA